MIPILSTTLKLFVSAKDLVLVYLDSSYKLSLPRQEPLHQGLLVLREGRHNECQGQEAELVTQGQQEKV